MKDVSSVAGSSTSRSASPRPDTPHPSIERTFGDTVSPIRPELPSSSSSESSPAPQPPAQSTPVQPTPAQPTSAQPTPAQPTPAQPTAAQPTTSTPTRSLVDRIRDVTRRNQRRTVSQSDPTRVQPKRNAKKKISYKE